MAAAIDDLQTELMAGMLNSVNDVGGSKDAAEGTTADGEAPTGEEEKKGSEASGQKEDAEDAEEVLRKKLVSEAEAETSEQPPIEEKKEEPPKTKVDEPVFTEITEDEYDDMIRSPEGYKKLNEIRKDDMRKAVEHAVKGAMLALPSVLPSLVRDVMEANKVVTKFYEENADLAAYRPYVAKVINKLKNEKPELSLSELVAAAEPVIRADLRLKKGEAGGKKEGQAPQKKLPFNPRGASGGARSVGGVPKRDGSSLDEQFTKMLRG